ncbi:MAG: hypothetical protein HYZ16_06980 [Bacteroidetes bacterium]|nr:hypothetical protein [Bacteroidota bacterium]
MKQAILLLALFSFISFWSCDKPEVDDQEVPKPTACMEPAIDTSLIVGSSLSVNSCSKDFETLVWYIDGREIYKGENFGYTFSTSGVYVLSLEATNSKGETDKKEFTVTVGYPAIKTFHVFTLSERGFNPMFPKYTLSLSATDYNTSWTKTVSGKYKDITSLPHSYENADPAKYRLGDASWEIKGALTWESTPSPTQGVTTFHSIAEFANGKYQIIIPGVVELVIDAEIMP